MRHKKVISGLFLGLLAGLFLGTKKADSYSKNLKKHDFPANTQKIGIRFSDKLRDAFRKKWIRIQ